MRLWRLSGKRYADALDGGYGLHFSGRWNTIGHAVTYCATSPSLCILEKLVHVDDPALLPELIMVIYEVPEDFSCHQIELGDLPKDWRAQDGLTQSLGDDWHSLGAHSLLRVPSAIVPIVGSPDVNVVINHAHTDAGMIRIENMIPFVLDNRLL